MRSHQFAALLIAIMLAYSTPAFALPIPILDYSYNNTLASSGSDTTPLVLQGDAILGASGSGVSGLAGDHALDNTGADTTDNDGVSHAADNNNIDGLTSLTVTGWFNVAQIFGSFGGGFSEVLIKKRTGGVGGFLAQSSNTDGQIRFFIDGSSVDSPTVYDDINAWVFFGLTYDGTSASNNALFYKGLVGSSVSLEHTGSMNEGTIDDDTDPLDVAYGDFSGALRPMQGLMDNVRIFGSVLSLADLEEIRLADINNEDLNTGAAPEPSTLALAVLGLLGLGFVARRRRK